MNAQNSDAAEREQRLDELVTAYLKAQEAGQTPDRQALLDSHPDLASELRGFFDDQDRLVRLAAPLCLLADTSGTDASSTPFPTKTGGKTAPPSPLPPHTFGDYTVLAPLGQGGMGLVWKARQRRPDRLVALKMFRAGDLASPTDVQRFRNEAEVIAQLDHPNILPVYEVGEHDGVHYFSMKLVEGGSLAAHLDSYRADPRAAARLMATIAHAVHYAHRRGILHRDLKPSNILLDSEGQPHVSDFGLAKRVETDSSLTQSGTLVGTPSYMAPEQTSGRKGAVTTATDVYGLGTVLYALLTGRPPFQGETVLETLEQVKNREPETPRRINAKVDRDLETICLKCLQKEPNRRYESAQAMAEDLERWLAGEPVSARPVSRRARFWRWCKRNPVVAWLTATLIVVMGLATMILAVSTVWLWRAQAETEGQRDSARKERDQAEARYQYARQVVDEFYTRFAENWLADEPRGQDQRRKFLEKALEFYEQFVSDHPDDLDARHGLARAYGRVGDVHKEVGRYPEAEAALRRAVNLFEQLVADEPSRTTANSDLALSYRKMGLILQATGRAGQAEPYFRKDLEQREKLVKRFPEKLEFRTELIVAFCNLGGILRNTGHLVEAEEAYRHAVGVQEPQDSDAETARVIRVWHASAVRLLAGFLADLGRLPEAETYLREALAAADSLAAVQNSSPSDQKELSNIYNALGYLLNRTGRPGEAKGFLSRAVSILKKRANDNPDIPSYQEDWAGSCDNLGIALRRTREFSEAAEAFRQAVTCQRELVKEFPAVPGYRSVLGAFLNDQALLEQDRGNLLEARQLFEEAIDHQQMVLKVNKQNSYYGSRLRTHYANLGQILLSLGDHAAAANAAERLSEVSFGGWSNSVLAVGILGQCGPLALKDTAIPKEKRQSLSQVYRKRARELLRKVIEHPPAEADAKNSLAWSLVILPDLSLQDPAWAVQLAQQAVEQAKQNKGYWNTLGVARYRARDWTGSTAALEKSCQLGRGGDGFDWFFLAMARWQLGDKEQARHWYSQAVSWQEKNAPQNDELGRFRAEAALLLDIKEQAPKKKEDVSPKK